MSKEKYLNATNVKPKFHKGVWVINRFGDVWHIDSFDSKNYHVSNGDFHCHLPIKKQDEMRLWPTQDAKDGDVLESDIQKIEVKNFDSNGFGAFACINTTECESWAVNANLLIHVVTSKEELESLGWPFDEYYGMAVGEVRLSKDYEGCYIMKIA